MTGQPGAGVDPNIADGFAILHADTSATLRRWRPERYPQESLRQAFLGFLAARPDGCARSCVPGHITASALVLDDAAEQVLLTLHPRVGSWLQLGGHCEATDASLLDAALREAHEESGLSTLEADQVPLRLDVHPITCSLGVPTRHFDIQFLVRAPAGAQPVRSAESTDLRWWPVHELPTNPDGRPSDLTELIAAALTRVDAP